MILANLTTTSVSHYQGGNSKVRVLLVDDEDIIRIILQNVLSEEFSLAEVETAEAAIPLLTIEPPDVIVVDKNLPGMTGLDLLRHVKAESPEIEVIVITGYASVESAVESLRLGAYDYLLKPFDDINIVVEKVRRAWEKKELAREKHQLLDQILAANHQLLSAHNRLRQGYLQTLSSMITALEARDASTRGHSDRVAELTGLLGVELRLDAELQANLVDGARLHDLGKIGIREDVLNKAGALTPIEYDHIKTHPTIGAEIIGKMEAYRHLVPLIRCHHERYDGKGYPDGLKGENIPLGARIIAVADTYDAMVSQRPYRAPRSRNEAFRIMKEVSGTQLDPFVVSAFFAFQTKHQVSEGVG